MSTIRKVLFTESSPNIGGQELQLLAQAAGLRQRGIETLIVCRPGSRIADIAAKCGLAHQYLPFRSSLHFPSLCGMYRILRDFRPDAVIAHSGHDANTVALAARLIKQRPRLIRARTYQPGKPHAWTYNTLFDVTLVPSLFLKRLLLVNPAINAERITVLYPGIDFTCNDVRSTEEIAPELQALVNEGRRLILHAAMFRAEKGHALILESLPVLVRKFPTLCYVIAGEGELGTSLRQQVIAMGLQEYVVFAGMVCNLPALIRHAELVVMPSSYEPLGMSQIEALGLGIPVVASNTGGIPETITDKHTGLLAEPENAQDWQVKLDQALSQPETMRRMAAVGREVVRERFYMARNLTDLLDHLESATHQRAAGASSHTRSA